MKKRKVKAKRRRQRPSWLVARLDKLERIADDTVVLADIRALHGRLAKLEKIADDTHTALTAIAYWIAQRQEMPPGRYRIVVDEGVAKNGRHDAR